MKTTDGETAKRAANLKKGCHYMHEIASALDNFSAEMVRVQASLPDKECARMVRKLHSMRRRVFVHAGLLKQLHRRASNVIEELQIALRVVKGKKTKELEELLQNPLVVEINMKHGKIALPPWDRMCAVYGKEDEWRRAKAGQK